MRITGIYQIQSIQFPDRLYVGSSVDITRRWSQHICKLQQGKHRSIKFQNHYNKYSISDLCFTVLQECSKEELISLEQYHIDTLNPCFNSSHFAGRVEFTAEVREKLSIAKLGHVLWVGKKHKEESILKMQKPKSEEHKKRMREGWKKKRNNK